MVETSRTTQEDSNLGFLPLLMLATLFVAGMLLAVPLVSGGGSVSLDRGLSARLPSWFGMALWLIELILYALVTLFLAWRVRSLTVLLGGIGLGLGVRIVQSLLIAVSIGTAKNLPVPGVFLENEIELPVYHALAVLIACAALGAPLRRLLQTGFRVVAPTGAGQAGRFSFVTRSSGQLEKCDLSLLRRGQETEAIAPEEGFVPVKPQDTVYGMVNIPAACVLACIPEAKPFLVPGQPVRVRLALIVPQLARATVWVTWRQIAARGTDEPAGADASRPDAAILDRWVRIPAEQYVMQVPRDYFEVTRPTPAWMVADEVPQERQFPAYDSAAV